jgi:hypothetical protein
MSGELALRLSDEERWEATRVLDAAVADGRITWEEHAERSAVVLAARTRGELRPQLADLGPVRPVEVAQPVVATLSKIIRTPEATHEVRAKARFGAVVLDLTGMRPGEQIHVTADAFCGKIAVHVPHDAVVIDDGTAVLGNRKIFGSSQGQAGPVIRIGGQVTLGNLKVFRDEICHW